MTSDSKKEFLTPSELAERWRVHIGSAEIEDLESAKRQSN